jgi:hypothetical protein
MANAAVLDGISIMALLIFQCLLDHRHDEYNHEWACRRELIRG